MAFLALLIGAILIIVALNNTYPQLAKELESDVPGFAKWAAAIVVILAIGYIPGLKTPVRWLMALIVAALLLSNTGGITTQLLNALKAFGTQSGGQAAGGSSAAGGAAAPGGGLSIGQAMSQAMNGVSSFFGSASQ